MTKPLPNREEPLAVRGAFCHTKRCPASLATTTGHLSNPSEKETMMPLHSNATSLPARKERPVFVGTLFTEIVGRLAAQRGGR